MFAEVLRLHNTAVSMSYFRARHMEVKERVYTILEDEGDPCNTEFLGNVTLPFPTLDGMPAQMVRNFYAAFH